MSMHAQPDEWEKEVQRLNAEGVPSPAPPRTSSAQRRVFRALGILLLIALVYVTGFVSGWSARWEGCDFATDQKVRDRLARAGLAVPPGATHLAYVHYGWMRKTTQIAMDFDRSERDPLLVAWLGQDKSAWTNRASALVSASATNIGHSETIDASVFAFPPDAKLVGYEIEESTTRVRSAVFDPDGRRLVLTRYPVE